jgi:hypothetical protein
MDPDVYKTNPIGIGDVEKYLKKVPLFLIEE